jgi:cytoskeleton protein RodZ
VGEIESLGKYLKNQRESKRISLREVAKATRVREHILKAIEEDQHDLLPPATYVKGFLLAYAKYLRLDPNDVLFRYEGVLKGEPAGPQSLPLPKPGGRVLPTQPSKPKPKISSAPPAEAEKKVPPAPSAKHEKKILLNTKQIWVVAGVIVASLIVSYFFSPYSSKRLVEPIHEKPLGDGKPSFTPSPPVSATTFIPEKKPVVKEKQPGVAPSAPVAAATSVPEKKLVSLQLKAVEVTWVSVQADDQAAKEMTFKPGEGVSVQASNQIRMILGNAGGMDLILNGKPLEKFGKSGEVVTLTLTSQGVEVKRHEKPKSP